MMKKLAYPLKTYLVGAAIPTTLGFGVAVIGEINAANLTPFDTQWLLTMALPFAAACTLPTLAMLWAIRNG